jgi:hypothetical protein
MDRIVLSVAMLPIAREFGFDIAAQVSGCHSCAHYGSMATQEPITTVM